MTDDPAHPGTTGTAPRPGGSGAPWWKRLSGRFWGVAILVVLAVVFIVENRGPTSIRVIVPVVVMPLWAALAGLFLVGVLVGAGLRRRKR